MKRITLQVAITVFLVFSFVACRNHDNPVQEKPTEFLDLKVDKAFKFESFSNLETSIKIANTKAAGVEIIQIYDAHPAKGGRIILTGSVDQNGEFKLPLRIASRLKEVYVGKLSSTGVNEFVAVQVKGSAIQFNFATDKSVATITPCGEDCDITAQGSYSGDFIITSGQVVCVDEGTSATFSKLKIETGGTLRVCGSVFVNNYKSGGGSGTIIVSPDGSINLPKYSIDFTIENYGNLNFSGNGTVQTNRNIHNWGEVSSACKMINQGTITNDGTFTCSKEFTNNPDAVFVNNCQFFITDESSNALKQNGEFRNNGYVSVDGTAEFSGSGNKITFLGVGSLIETEDFKIMGNISGPASQGSQITANDDGQSSAGVTVSGYVDLCVENDFSPDNATYGEHVTFCDYEIDEFECDENEAPSITSSLQIGGLVNQAITPYVITATGTETISYTATGLPSGLTYNSSSHTISGTPASAGTFEVELTATNFMGSDTETLVIVITQPAAAPVITSVLTAEATVDETFNYTLTASGAGPITYNVTNLPDGLSFDPDSQLISGSPSEAGTYNINLFATNEGGTTTETLVLTVGTPPTITSALTAEGTADVQFDTYTLTATGSPVISYQATNLPQGLSFDADLQTINGTPTFSGVYDVLLTATNSYGIDVETLVITINVGVQPPVITSSLTANAQKNYPFTYSITADGSVPLEFNATNLPAGLEFSGNTISGIPIVEGTFNIPISATNSAGTDTETLVLVVAAGSSSDADGDEVPDNLDEYPSDPDRAFNSYYPNETDFGSLAFEDLWPGYGDYDFNDFVVNFNYKIVSNAQNEVVDVVAKYQIMADGASMDNGFGIIFNTASSNVQSVTGCIRFGNAVVMDPIGFELGHTNQTVIIPFDAINPIMDGGMANTIPDGKYIQTTVNTVTINFATPQASIGQPPYNPFIFVDQERGREVHLKDQAPTDLVNPEFFGTWSDASVPESGLYYRSSNGLPWAVEIPVNFDYPKEVVDILVTHLKFADWAQSSGIDYPNWYMDNTGFRNQENIYVIPQQ
ncbi:MAG: LruC domain-containing protein [Bacteroidales bacterium]|nr:LruC domain-containing protein [Bacteroidales bacterium]